MWNKKILLLSLSTIITLASCGEKNGEDSISNSEDVKAELVNGGFELGDLSGWNAKGLGAFEAENVTDANTVNDVNVDKVGKYFFSGSEVALPSYKGSLESDYFVLGGIGKIAYKIGAAKNQEKINIQFFKEGSDSPLSFTANDEKEVLTSIGNKDFNGTTITDQMIRNVVDLSEYLDEKIKIVITDNDSASQINDYSYVNLDDFVVLASAEEKNAMMLERENQLIQYVEDDFEEDPTITTLSNGGFETGDLSGWKILEGKAFSNENIVSSEETFWGDRKYYATGNYFLRGFATNEGATGKIRSEKFTLEDKEDGGYVSFKMGGAKSTSCFVSIYDETQGKEISRTTNTAFIDPSIAENLSTYFVDLSEYKGDVLYFIVTDSAVDGGFAAINVDDFRVNLTAEEVKQEIQELKEWSHTVDDPVSKPAYEKLYNEEKSYPFAGEAPIIVEEEGYAYKTTILPTSSYELNLLKPYLNYSDDYTGKNDLVISFDTVNNEEIENSILDLSEDGDYEIAITVTDAYEQVATSKLLITVDSGIVLPATIENGGFETGDLTGWTVLTGNIEKGSAVIRDETFWGEKISYNQEGNYHFDGWKACTEEAAGYSLKSSMFKLSGSGYISFRMGGNAARLSVYKADGTKIKTFKNDAFADVNFAYVAQGCRLATMVSYYADLSDYLNEDLYIVIEDKVISSSWAVAFFDAIETYIEDASILSTKKDIVFESYGSTEEVEINWQQAVEE